MACRHIWDQAIVGRISWQYFKLTVKCDASVTSLKVRVYGSSFARVLLCEDCLANDHQAESICVIHSLQLPARLERHNFSLEKSPQILFILQKTIILYTCHLFRIVSEIQVNPLWNIVIVSLCQTGAYTLSRSNVTWSPEPEPDLDHLSGWLSHEYTSSCVNKSSQSEQ